MRFVSFLSLAACLTALVPLAAQDAKDKPAEVPKAPAGWRYVAAKDQSYKFLFPTQVTNSGTSERSIRTGQATIKTQSSYCVTKDNLVMTADAINLTFVKTAKFSVDDVFKMLSDQYKTDGFEITELKPVRTGRLTGKEFYATKPDEVARIIMIPDVPRMYGLSVVGKSKDEVTTPAADQFLNSLVLTRDAAKAAVAKAKEDAAKQAALRASAKPGDVKWTLDPKTMEIPDAPVCGTIMGQEFITDNAEIWGGTLYVSQGRTGAFYNAHVQLSLSLKPGEGYAGKTFLVDPTSNKSNITVNIARIKPGAGIPTDVPFSSGYAMKLEFGEAKNGKIPGKIYLCTPDKEKTAVAGTFEFRGK